MIVALPQLLTEARLTWVGCCARFTPSDLDLSPPDLASRVRKRLINSHAL